MAQGYYGSICLEDLFGQAIAQDQAGNKWVNLSQLQGAHIQRPQNGKTYVNIGVWVNDQPDNYGQIAGISLSQSQQEREAKAKRVYIGNLKQSGQQQAAPQQQAPYNPYAPQQAAPAGYPPAPVAGPQQAPVAGPPNPYAQGQPFPQAQGQPLPQAPQPVFQPTPMGPPQNGNFPF